MNIQITIHGYLVGPIWMPGCECSKPLTYDATAQQRRTVGGKMTLRDHVLAATNDGDFASCRIADGTLAVTYTKPIGRYVAKRTRYFPLDMFPSISDRLMLDWGGPQFSDE